VASVDYAVSGLQAFRNASQVMKKTGNKQPDAENLMEFPCRFPLKVFGYNDAGFERKMLKLLREFCDESTSFEVKKNESKKGKYQSLTITFIAQSREQMDAIYQALSDSEDVVMSL
jgi:putative lipoic acid-binding regulatory protein